MIERLGMEFEDKGCLVAMLTGADGMGYEPGVERRPRRW